MCQSTKKRKLGPKTVDCVFLGYSFHVTGYRFLIIKSDVHDMYVDTIIESRDATFFENEFPMKNTPSKTSHETIIPHEQECLFLQIMLRSLTCKSLRRMTL